MPNLKFIGWLATWILRRDAIFSSTLDTNRVEKRFYTLWADLCRYRTTILGLYPPTIATNRVDQRDANSWQAGCQQVG
jgi:hypothetical protein